ncbi:hypothetical protein BBP40_006067 [Aspergillus hancockii]|nr:hypothetical protein BBP40_006067 [Aspergillus hancockii]
MRGLNKSLDLDDDDSNSARVSLRADHPFPPQGQGPAYFEVTIIAADAASIPEGAQLVVAARIRGRLYGPWAITEIVALSTTGLEAPSIYFETPDRVLVQVTPSAVKIDHESNEYDSTVDGEVVCESRLSHSYEVNR